MVVAAALMVGGVSGHAADIPAPQPVPYNAPAVVPAGYNWTGFYIGVMGGYAKGAGDANGFDGGFAGGTVGYNWQPAGSNFVFGIEGDAAWTNWGNSVSAIAPAVVVTVTSEASAIATIRARAGVSFDRALVYVTGGGAWLRNELSVRATVAGFTAGLSDTQNHMGYAVGAGLEYAIGGNWSAKFEYLYLGFGSETYFPGIAGGVASGDFNMHTGKVGLNYRF